MMTDGHTGRGGQASGGDDLVEIDLNFESMRRFQGEFSPNLSKGGIFIDTGEPLNPGSVVRFRVILPEEFVFLEGTGVVEWIRSAEAICDGSPGMALRFVTLSAQNQELVEQLVQDYVDTGGTPFDLDVRPVPADFPTDSLEGAPARSTETLDEGYRLTVRHTGPALQAEALRSLAEAMPEIDEEEEPEAETETLDVSDGVEPEDLVPADPVEAGAGEIDASDADEADEAEAVAVADVRGFEIVSIAAAEAVTAIEETNTDVEAIGDPPEFDWSAELDASSEPEEPPPVEAPAEVAETPAHHWEAPEEIIIAEQEELSFPIEDDDEQAAPAEVTLAAGTGRMPEVLPPPSAFADGPEVIDDVGDGRLGGPAFDVSLPEHDDEPDTTPVLPDEGRDDVTVTTDGDFDEPPRSRRPWPLALVAVAVLVAGGWFLWPHARDWYASRDSSPPQEQGVVEPAQVVDGDQPRAGSAEVPPASVDEEQEPVIATGSASEAVEIGEPEPVIEEIVEEAEREPAPVAVRLGSADTVTSIDVDRGPSGTVIEIRANGSVEDGILSMETLASPPRVLVRVRGITSTYRPYTIDAMTPEVSQVRSGLHEERRPSELWIVIDLVEEDVAVAGVSIAGDLAKLVLARP